MDMNDTATNHLSTRSNGSKEFMFSGISAVAAICITNPIDVVKTRLQLQGELLFRKSSNQVYRGILDAFVKIGKREGIRGLQKGLAPACLLQFSNVSMRFGAYGLTKSWFQITPDSNYRVIQSLAAGAFSGVLAAVVSNPFFLLKTRFQAQCGDASIAVGYQRKQMTLREAWVDIYKTEGIRSYYRGLSAFIPRVVAASAVQLSTYDIIKHFLMTKFQMKDNLKTHVTSSFVTGIGVVFAMQPFDFAATRLMNQQSSKGIGCLYTGTWDVLVKTIRMEGILGVYKGAFASYLRFGPYCVLVHVILEQLRNLDQNLSK